MYIAYVLKRIFRFKEQIEQFTIAQIVARFSKEVIVTRIIVSAGTMNPYRVVLPSQQLIRKKALTKSKSYFENDDQTFK
jgi:hypothetical protein